MSAAGGPLLVHASCVALGPGAAVLIQGASGRGKSTLALQLMEGGAQLLGDDRIILWREGAALYARAPSTIAGLIEVRGLGLLRAPALRLARVVLVIDADAPEPPRLPGPRQLTLCDVALPCLDLSRSATFPAAVLRYLRGSHLSGPT